VKGRKRLGMRFKRRDGEGASTAKVHKDTRSVPPCYKVRVATTRRVSRLPGTCRDYKGTCQEGGSARTLEAHLRHAANNIQAWTLLLIFA
jgi:hypothetical protein